MTTCECLDALRDKAKALLNRASDRLDEMAEKRQLAAYDWWVGRRDTLVELIEKANALAPAKAAALTSEVNKRGWLPDEGVYLIRYDDRSREDELFAECGAKRAAFERYKQISGNWNAHLFVKIDSNSRDCTTPNATPHPAAPTHD